MPLVELDDIGVRFPLYGAWNRSPAWHLWERLMPGAGRSGIPRDAGIEALRGVSLTLEPGRRLAVLGANGSGKTTLGRVIAGLIRPVAGRARIAGHPFAVLGIGCESYPGGTIRDAILFRALLAGRSPRQAGRIADQALDFGGLSDVPDRSAGDLSSGTIFRVGIGAAIALEADIIVLDEVMDTADPDFVRAVKHHLISHRSDAIIVVIERSRAILDGLCNRAVVLDGGRIVDHGDYDRMLARHGERHTF